MPVSSIDRRAQPGARLTRAAAARWSFSRGVRFAMCAVLLIAAPLSAQTVPLAGNHPDLEQALVRGSVDASTRMTLTAVLALRNRAALERLQKQQRDSSSRNYHRWLTPDEFNARFGPRPTNVEAVADWLSQQGFTIVEINQRARYIRFGGPVAQVQSVFRTTVVSMGDDLFANVEDPHIPARFRGVIASIDGLDNLRAAVAFPKIIAPGPRARARLDAWNGKAGAADSGVVSVPNVTIGGATAFGPSDLYTFYDVTPVFTAGFDGAGDCIGIVGDSDYLASAVTLFNSTFGLAAETINTILSSNKNGGFTNPGRNGDEIETLLDLEWVHAAAPGATVNFYLGDNGNTTNGSLFDAIQKAVTDNACSVISVSFGVCSSNPTATAASFDTILSQAAAQGQSVFVSSGDDGAPSIVFNAVTHTCVTGTSRNVSEPAQDPNVTAVGGTRFTPTYDGGGDVSTVNDTTRTAWNANGGATGGGASTIFAKPSYQVGVTPNDGVRDVPDVSLLGDPGGPGVFWGADHSGTAAMDCCLGGTSLSSPVFAGFVKLLEQQGASRLGNVNPLIYAFAATNGSANGFRDVTSGNNTFQSVLGFAAGTGYDQATGWGEIDVNVFVNALAGNTPIPTPTPTGVTPTPTPTATPAGPLDNFTCYKVGATSGSAKFPGIPIPPGVSLIDQFNSSLVQVKKPQYLCNSTNLGGENPGAETHTERLTGYQIKSPVKQPLPLSVIITDELNPGGLVITPKKALTLLLPSLTSFSMIPPLTGAFSTDHFECYKVAPAHGAAKFIQVIGIPISDQFGAMLVEATKPALLCNPVDKDGESPGAESHAAHLMCYQMRQLSLPKFLKITTIFVNNQFGPEVLDAKKPSHLCIPATVTP